MAQMDGEIVGALTSEILQALSKADSVMSVDTFPHTPFGSLKAALDRLSARSMLVYEQVEREEAILEYEAENIVSNRSHEARVFEAVRKAQGGLTIRVLEREIDDPNVTKLSQGKTHSSDILANLKKRKLMKMQKFISFRIKKGPKYAMKLVKEETDLSHEMLASGSWKSATLSEWFRPLPVCLSRSFTGATIE
ncbi:MAG: hypothetical protein Q9160_007316 [Pyrenula sp. 1 TL-2023]